MQPELLLVDDNLVWFMSDLIVRLSSSNLVWFLITDSGEKLGCPYEDHVNDGNYSDVIYV